MGLHGGVPCARRSTARTERRTPRHAAAHPPPKAPAATPTTPPAGSAPTTSPDRLPFSARWPRSVLAKASRPSTRQATPDSATATQRLLQVEVVSILRRSGGVEHVVQGDGHEAAGSNQVGELIENVGDGRMVRVSDDDVVSDEPLLRVG